MKHVQRRTALAALAGLVVFGAAPAAFAEGEGDEVSESELQEDRDLIAEVDSDLAAQGTSVSEQLALLEEETGERSLRAFRLEVGRFLRKISFGPPWPRSRPPSPPSTLSWQLSS